MESIKIKKVIPQPNLVLHVEFNNGVCKEYNVGMLFKQFPEYKILEHKPFFDTVYVDCGGYSVAWTPDIDISEWELWDNGSSILS
jgi:hypothetical protein